MRTTDGITLVELLVTVSVASILATVAVPSLYSVINNNRLTTVTNTLLSSFYLTRSEAIKRNTRVTMAANNGNWKNGWVVFVDGNANAVVDPDEQIIQQHEAIRGEILIQGNRHVSRYISYLSSGFNRTLSGALQLGTISVCDGSGNSDGTHARALRVNYGGRWWVSRQPAHINCN